MKIYQALATAFTAWQNCDKRGNQEWRAIWYDRIITTCRERLPSGSGVDCGTAFNWNDSKPDRLVLNASFHHMDRHGVYDGWTEHKVIITPTLTNGFLIRVTGRNRNDIKTYLGDLIAAALNEELGEWAA